MEPIEVRFRWVIGNGESPLENALVRFEDDGISEVVTNSVVSTTSPVVNAALIPGVVNAHTHLEFSDLRDPLTPAEPFTDWIRALLQHRQARRVPVGEIIETGLQEAKQCGTTLLGEINTTGEHPQYATAETRPLVFRELIGLTADTMTKQLEIAREHVTNAGPLSPHAPYSVHPDLLRDIVKISQTASVPVAMHVAETLAERELLAHGTGEFRKMLEEFGLFSNELFRDRRPLDELRELSKADRALVVHGNYLDDEEIGFLSTQPQMTVVYCPRTHAFFGHQPHPWRTLIDRGIRVALGTDSRASNPDLSVWEEAQFLHRRYPDVPSDAILRLATRNGEAALLGEQEANDDLHGRTLNRLSVIHLPSHSSGDPYGTILHPESRCRSAREFLESRQSGSHQ